MLIDCNDLLEPKPSNVCYKKSDADLLNISSMNELIQKKQMRHNDNFSKIYNPDIPSTA